MKIWGIAGPYHLRFPETIEGEDEDKGRDLIGYHRWAQREITVRADLRGPARTSVIWHEWVHAVMADGGLAISKKNAERVCDLLAAALTGSGTPPPIVK